MATVDCLILTSNNVTQTLFFFLEKLINLPYFEFLDIFTILDFSSILFPLFTNSYAQIAQKIEFLRQTVAKNKQTIRLRKQHN